MFRWIRRLLLVTANLVVVGAVVFLADRYWDVVPAGLHGAIFAGGSVLSAVLLFLGGQIFGKFDKLLQDSEKYEFVRTSRIYGYVGGLRSRLFVWAGAGLLSLFVTAGCAYIIKEKTFSDLSSTIVLGYAALSLVALASIRICSAYLRFDGFRLKLLRLIDAEDKRLVTLREMRKPTVLGTFDSQAPPHVQMQRAAVR